MQDRPRLRLQSEKLQCVSGFRLPVCKARSSPDSGTVVLPQNQPRWPLLRAPGSLSAGGRKRRGAGAWGARRGGDSRDGGGRATGRSTPPSPAAPGAELGREADKAPPAPSPTATFQKGGRGWRRKGRGRRKRRREGAAGGTGQDRADLGGEGGGVGRPRRTGRREGFLRPKINKLFLFTCGVGGGGERALRRRLPSPKPTLCHRAPARAPGESPRQHWHHHRRRGLTDRERVRFLNRTTAGPPLPGSAPPIAGRSARETGEGARPRHAPGFPSPGPPSTRAARWGRGRRHLSQASGLPSPRKESKRTGEGR